MMAESLIGENRSNKARGRRLGIRYISPMETRGTIPWHLMVSVTIRPCYYGSGHSSHSSRRRSRRPRDEPDRMLENLGGYKMKIPPFHGRNNPDEYMDWEKKCDSISTSQHHWRQPCQASRVRIQRLCAKMVGTNHFGSRDWWCL
ncbi:unnamed protein product [Microthlaspi erraticum]|uniref:Uncharacterized protein n=1 Tax=Microthlaspi erraticum TaxID=1685480 RepID=A0A6D2JVX4_9BRAS|nr:unnamed protein product [Microthlaspi erraticum]